MLKKTKLAFHALAASFTTGVMMSQAGMAFAQGGSQNIRSISNQVSNSLGGLPQILSAVAYLGGAGLTIAGLFKLKAHVDSPQNNMLKDAVGRLAVGGGLLASPYLAQSLGNTLGQSGTSLGKTGGFTNF